MSSSNLAGNLAQKLSRVPVSVVVMGLVGGLVAGAYGAWFLYEVVTASVGRGGYAYTSELPATPPVKVQEAPFCAQKSMKWVGCF